MIRALYKKEILDILRDKKTILVMILIPLIVYPLIFVGALSVVSMIASNQQAATYRVAFSQVSEEKAICEVMEREKEEREYFFQVVEVEQWEDALNNGTIDACVTQETEDEKVVYHIQYLSSVSASSTAADRMLTVLEDYREELRKQAITENGMDVEAVLYPLYATEVDLSTDEESFGNLIGSILPFLMVVSILMGALYPAIDATAGEKERGTLETLLTLPVSNLQLIVSKFLAVSTVASVSAFLNFISVGIIGVFLYQSLSLGGAKHLEVDMISFLPALLLMLLCVIVFAMLMSALCLCICIFAKSFKEAQNYTTPLLIVVMLVSYVGVIPDLSLDSTYAVIPIANVVLLVKNIFTFQYNFANLFLVLVINVAYSFLAVLLLSKIYNSESILFGEGGSVKLFESRANMKKGQMPGIGDACLLLSVSLLVLVYIGSIATAKWGFAGVAVEQLLFLVLTLGFAWYMKADCKTLFSLRMPKVRRLLGGFFLWVGTYAGMLLLSVPLAKIVPESASSLEQTAKWFEQQSFVILFLVVAVLPAICEEILFRGFLFGTFQKKWKGWAAIVVSGILFGVYHMSLIKAITISFFGFALAYSVYRSGSIFVSMAMHLCNNGLAVLATAYPKQVYRILPFLAEETLTLKLGIGLGIAAVAGIGFGVLLLGREKMEQNTIYPQH